MRIATNKQALLLAVGLAALLLLASAPVAEARGLKQLPWGSPWMGGWGWGGWQDRDPGKLLWLQADMPCRYRALADWYLAGHGPHAQQVLGTCSYFRAAGPVLC